MSSKSLQKLLFLLNKTTLLSIGLMFALLIVIDIFLFRAVDNHTLTEKRLIMGSLLTTKDYLGYDPAQKYELKNNKDSIHISLPPEHYRQNLEQIIQHNKNAKNIIIIVSTLLAIIFTIVILLVRHYNSRIKALNYKLIDKVQERTQELYELNDVLKELSDHLEERVEEELEKNRKNEKVMLSQARHAAMGEMISLIAHQWRQPLSEISMITSNIMLDTELEEIDLISLKNDTEAIQRQTKHMSQTIDDFANFFKPDRQKEYVNVNDVCDKALDILSKLILKSNIQVQRSYKVEHNISIYERSLLHVIVNLINNVKDAYESSDAKDRYLKITTYKKDDTIILEFLDNAGGIDEDKLEKIFDPYFSTKNKHNGTGLGLYMSKEILEKHMHSSIEAQNYMNGALFRVSIPYTENCQEN